MRRPCHKQLQVHQGARQHLTDARMRPAASKCLCFREGGGKHAAMRIVSRAQRLRLPTGGKAVRRRSLGRPGGRRHAGRRHCTARGTGGGAAAPGQESELHTPCTDVHSTGCARWQANAAPSVAGSKPTQSRRHKQALQTRGAAECAGSDSLPGGMPMGGRMPGGIMPGGGTAEQGRGGGGGHVVLIAAA